MRSLTVLIAVLLLVAATATAQPQVKFGVKAGVVMSTMTGDGWDTIEALNSITIEKKSLISPTGGVFAEIMLGPKNLSLQPEILYVMKGAKADVTDGTDKYTRKIKNDYVEVPVLVKYSFTTGSGKPAPFLMAGPMLAFNVGSKIEDKNPPADNPDLGDKDIDNAKSVDFGLAVGGGIGVMMGQAGMLTFDVRYTAGLGDVYDDASAEMEEGADTINLVDEDGKALDFKNGDFRLMVGFRF